MSKRNDTKRACVSLGLLFILLTAPSYVGATEIDTDGDTIIDGKERMMGTDPENRDSDGDSFDDATEIRHGYDPLNPEPKKAKKPFVFVLESNH